MSTLQHGHARHKGRAESPTYRSWTAMKSRCQDSGCKDYPTYGGRGVRVHPQWAEFSTFLRDVGERPSLHHTLDRYPNREGNYEPGNVRWATKKEQARNRSSSRLVAIDGVTRCLAEWAEVAALPYSVLCDRMRRGWPASDLLLPFGSKRKK